jgi:membrane protein implicated in regulation of membrane protease activity
MPPSLHTWLWLGAGIVLLGSELVLPGLVAAFLGAGAVTVAGLREIGLLESLPASFGAWALSSSAYFLLFRSTVRRWLGSGERTRHSTSEGARQFGTIVEVLEPIAGGEVEGRIRFEGTTWPALSNAGPIPAGGRARLVHRDNLAWVVEPVARELAEAGGEGTVAPARLPVG